MYVGLPPRPTHPRICRPRMHACALQVRAVIDLLPEIDVVPNDAFNSSPTDPKYMGPDMLDRYRRGEKLPSTTMRTPLVGLLSVEITRHEMSLMA